MIETDVLKEFGWHLRVQGAYVQQPNPAVVGLDEHTVIGSNDAASLYPISGIHQNLGYDTLRDRIYDFNIINPIIKLITQVYQNKSPETIQSALAGFKNALLRTVKEYVSRRTVKNKKDALEFTLEYYPILLERILKYPGKLEDIFKPIDDRTYYLLKSNLYPLLESITWLSPQNPGYNKTSVEYVLFHDKFLASKKSAYVFKEINTTKTTFQLLSFDEILEHFPTRIINSYGTLFDLHDVNLSYDVNLSIEALVQRGEIKDRMLVLKAIYSQFNHLSEDSKNYFKTETETTLDPSSANRILDEIHDTENREKRLAALTSFKFKFNLISVDDIGDKLQKLIKLRINQLNIQQLGIKVSMNSGYGIFAMPTWVYSSTLIGNSFTNAGKIYGIKIFQAVSVDEITKQERSVNE